MIRDIMTSPPPLHRSPDCTLWSPAAVPYPEAPSSTSPEATWMPEATCPSCSRTRSALTTGTASISPERTPFTAFRGGGRGGSVIKQRERINSDIKTKPSSWDLINKDTRNHTSVLLSLQNASVCALLWRLSIRGLFFCFVFFTWFI